MASPSSPTRLLRRCRLLDAARGGFNSQQQQQHQNGLHRHRPRHPLPTFPLELQHFGPRNNNSPTDFHQNLCNLIRNAKQRVYLASLYIGPAADPTNQPREKEFLNVLSEINKHNVDVKILLDYNRALRPVPRTTTIDSSQQSSATTTTTTTSAKTVSAAIKDKVHLFQVLPSPLDRILPNPLNEVGGVFHIKLYIVDDDLIISGANLSEEYFKDRQDRYLWICNGGNGLVDFYAQLIELLCQRSYTYHQIIDDPNDDEDEEETASVTISPPPTTTTTTTTSQSEFLQALAEHFQDKSPQSAEELLTSSNDTVAVGVPTIFVPSLLSSSSSSSSSPFVTDTESTLSLLEEGAVHHDTLQLSSAYLNPTAEMMSVLRHYDDVQFLTAGHVSHGFRPKKKAGNKGKEWIPTVFDHLADDTLNMLNNEGCLPSSSSSATTPTRTKAQLYHWEREDWTFHAKGIWLREGAGHGDYQHDQVAAAIVGSSNFGERSFVRDMESNLSLVFVPDDDMALQGSETTTTTTTTVAQSFGDDWDELVASSRLIVDPKNSDNAAPLPWTIQWMFPFIKSYF